MMWQFSPKYTSEHNSGFTLVELMIVMMIFGIVMTAVIGSFMSQNNTYLAQEQVVGIQQNLRAGLGIMAREVRMAGYDSRTGGTAKILSATGTKLSFQIYDDANAVLRDITYELDDVDLDGDDDLSRTIDGIQRMAAENIERLEFYYTPASGTKTLTPATDNIRSVQITMLARAAIKDKDLNYSNTRVYVRPSGVGNWGAFNDRYRRRFLTTIVKCRNMGL